MHPAGTDDLLLRMHPAVTGDLLRKCTRQLQTVCFLQMHEAAEFFVTLRAAYLTIAEKSGNGMENVAMIKTVNVIGLGALGMLFGGRIAENIGRIEGGEIHFVMDPERCARHSADSYVLNGVPTQFALQSSAQASPADLVIVAVKYTALEEALDTMASSVDDHTIIISVLNGITSEKIIGRRYPKNRIIDCVAQGMDAMRTGTQMIYTKIGALHIGIRDRKNEEMQQALSDLQEFFERVGLPYVHEDDILYRLWFKFMLNVGINQACMVYGVGYGEALEPGNEACMAAISAMREVVVIAQEESATLTDRDVNKAVEILRTLDPEATPSMGQDRIAGRKSEADMFAGTVIELGRRHGILTPANAYLYRRVHEIEAEYV